MKHSALLLTLFSAAALCWTAGCSHETEAAGRGEADAAAPAADEGATEEVAALEPVTAALAPRAAARWELIEKEDWIQSYDYLAPQIRKQQDLGSYLAGSSDHHYLIKSDPVFVGLEGKLGFTQVVVEWTPTHAEIQQAANLSDGELTQDIDMTETWAWQDGEWYFIKAQRSNDFRRENPSFFKRQREAAEAK